MDVVVDRGQNKTITIPPQAVGRYRFYCRFHEGEGMRGQIAYS